MRAITSRWPVVLAVVAGGLAVGSPTALASGATAGQSAPALIAQTFAGEKFDLSAQHGKAVVLNFWASWCVPCRSEMPLLEAISREYSDRVVVVGLSADDPHDRKDAIQAAKRVSYITGMLAEAHVNGFGAPQVLPQTYIIDPMGTVSAILQANQGAVSADRLRAAVAMALHEAIPVAPAHEE